MTELLRLLFQFHSEYAGDPRFISGNAFRHALSRQINTSIGIFTTINQLTMPKTYQDFYRIRTQKCFLFPHFTTFFDRNSGTQSVRYFFTPSYITFDVLEPPADLLETIAALEPLQLGGQRHSGCGMVILRDSLSIEVDELPMPSAASHIVLIAPMVFLPPFIEPYDCRREQLAMWAQGRRNPIKVVAPGQFFRIKSGEDSSIIARKGILRKAKANKMLLSQFGFGEFMVQDWKRSEVNHGLH